MQKKKALVLPLLLWTLAAGGVVLMFFFSGQDGASSGELSLKVARFIRRMLPQISLDFHTLHFYVRKLAHFGIFAAEGALLCGAWIATLKSPGRGALLAAIMCLPMAVLNEFHQYFMDGRSCEIRDMFIDSAGALSGILFSLILARHICRRNVII